MTDIKNITMLYGGNKDEDNALEIAFIFAELFAAHLQVFHISPDPKAFIATAFAGISGPALAIDGIAKDVEKRYKKSQKAARRKYNDFVKKHFVDYDQEIVTPNKPSASFEAITGNADEIISVKGRLSDLIIMSSTVGEVNNDYANAKIGSLFSTRRPVLFIPPGDIEKDIDMNVVIAWDGSAEATSAVIASLPLLKRSANFSTVSVLTNYADYNKNFPISPQELCFYLKQHGIDAQPILSKENDLYTPLAILSEAKKLEAGMIVMGAFGHSRMREMLLGGVTNSMLEKADIPVLMAH